MAAKRTVDPCIFCSSLPCTCDDAKPKAKPRGKRLPTGVPANTTTVELPVDDVQLLSTGTSKLARMKAKAAEDAARKPATGPVAAPAQLLRPPTRGRQSVPAEAKQIDTEKMKARFTASIDEETAVLNGAIRALAPLLSDEQRREFSEILSTEPSLDEQKLLWKARHRDHQAAASS